MIAEPPVITGALHVRETCVLPAVPTTLVGALGTANVVIEFEAADATDVPALFVAVTVNV